MSSLNNILNKLIKIVAILIAFYLLYSFRLVIVNGRSMENTLHNKQLLIGYFCKNNLKIDRGDIIIFTKENREHGPLLKRVIGINGDKIKLINNELYINEKKVQEDYIKESMSVNADNLEYVVPSDKVFVMGDNRNNSLDSRDKSIEYVDINKEVSGKLILDLEKFGITYSRIKIIAILFVISLIFGLAIGFKGDNRDD